MHDNLQTVQSHLLCNSRSFSYALHVEISQCFLQSLFRHLSCRNRNADLKVLTLITHINGKFKVTSVCRNTFFIQKTRFPCSTMLSNCSLMSSKFPASPFAILVLDKSNFCICQKESETTKRVPGCRRGINTSFIPSSFATSHA